MRVKSQISYDEIEAFLEELGNFNVEDTRKSLSELQYFYRVLLDEDEFLSLVFLSNPEVRIIVPHNADRRLRAVAERAIQNIDAERMSENWHIAEIFSHTSDMASSRTLYEFKPLVIRDLRRSEVHIPSAFKYLHDGSHRSLGLAMLILMGKVEFVPVSAYLATNQHLG